MRTQTSQRSRPVRSVARALDVLEVLTAQEEVGLVELSSVLELPPSSAHRLLATLARQGWVAQNPDSARYLLSHGVVALAARVHERTALLRSAARPYLDRARKVSGVAANLVVLHGSHVVYLDQVDAPNARTITGAGHSVPAHTSGAGKVLMAQLADDHLPILGSPEPYERRTGRTITTAAALRRELAAIRRRGFAIDDEEHAVGVACVAAPVFDPAGAALAAISVSGIASRMRDVGLRELGESLVILTGELSRELRAAGGA